MRDQIKATVITDASFDSTCGAAGWAAWVRVDNIPTAIKGSGQIRKANARTSEEAEIHAAIQGCLMAMHRGQATVILLQSDNMAVVRMDSKKWLDFMSEYRHLTVTTRHVPGHTAGEDARRWVNNWCDREAKREMRAKRRELTTPDKRGHF